MSMPHSASPQQSGMALILVIVVISALIVIATPFAISMRMDENSSSRYAAQVQARMLARAAANHAIANLYKSHPSVERQKLLQSYGQNQGTGGTTPGGTGTGNEGGDQEGDAGPAPGLGDPRYDSPRELQPEFPKSMGMDFVTLSDGQILRGKITSDTRDQVTIQTKDGEQTLFKADIKSMARGVLKPMDPKGTILSVNVEDESGKIDLNTATPRVIGALLGATQLVADIKTEDTEIPVSDVRNFYTDHNPETIDGIIRIGFEIIAYKHIGKKILDNGAEIPAFQGCIRGVYLTNLFSDTFGDHATGSTVLDGRAVKIAYHPILKQPGTYKPYAAISQIREIANWSLLELMLQIMRGVGVNDETLMSAGVSDEALAKVGLAMQNFKVEVEPLTDKEKEVLGKLRTAGMDVTQLEKMGKARLKRFLFAMSKRSDESLEKLLANKKWIEKRNKRFQTQAMARSLFKEALKKRFPEAMHNMAELIAGMKESKANVESIGPVELERFKKYFTIHSPASRKWTDSMPILRDIYPNYRHFTRIRIPFTPDAGAYGVLSISEGGFTEYRKVYYAGGIASRGYTDVLVIPPLEGSYTAHQAQVRLTVHPRININTADPYILRALFVGLQYRGSKDYVTVQEAEGAAKVIVASRAQGGIRNFDQLAQVLYQNSDQPIDGSGTTGSAEKDGEAAAPVNYSKNDARSIMANAIDPHSPYIRRGTFGFCFQSHNTYTISAHGVVNSPAGTPVAGHSFKQVVQVSPPKTLKWVRESQLDFTGEVTLARRPFNLPGRRMRNFNTFPGSPYLRGSADSPWIFPTDELNQGEFRLRTVKMPRSLNYTNNFDGEQYWKDEGLLLRNSVHQVPTLAQALGINGFPTTRIRLPGGKTLYQAAPGRVEFWVKNMGTGGNGVLFDTGVADNIGRIVLYYDSGRRRIVFKVADDTLESRAITLEAPLSLQPQRWYHFCAYWKGSNVGDLALFVDGKAVGSHKYACRTMAAMDQDQQVVRVDSTADFPLRGLLRIGDEIVSYIAKSGNSFQLATKQVDTGQKDPQGNPIMKRVRASRNGARTHSQNSLVTLYGYANPIAQDMRVGQCQLRSPLLTPTPRLQLRLKTGIQTPSVLHPQALELKVNVKKEYDIINPNAPAPGQTPPPGTPIPPAPTFNDFPPRGYLYVAGEIEMPTPKGGIGGSGPNPPGGIKRPGAEIMYYEGRTNSSFLQLTRGAEGTTAHKFVNITSITLMSIEVSNLSDYPNVSKIQIYKDPQHAEWITVTKAKDRANHLLLGTISTSNQIRPTYNERRDFGRGRVFFQNRTPHAPGELIMPVYRTWSTSNMGGGDLVTVYDQSLPDEKQWRNRMIVSRTSSTEYAFTTHLPRIYKTFIAEAGLIMKWPTGMLPLTVQPNMTFGGRGTPVQIGGTATGEFFSGVYDEIRMERLSISNTNTTITNNNARYFSAPAAIQTDANSSISSSSSSITLLSTGLKSQLDSMRYRLDNNPPTNPRALQRLQRLVQRLEQQYSRRRNNWNSFINWFVRPNPSYFQYGGISNYFTHQQRAKLLQSLRYGGLVKIGDEVVFTSGIDFRNNTLQNCVRGLLSTQAKDYGAGERITPLEWPIAGTISYTDHRRMRVSFSSYPRPFSVPQEGYVFLTRTGRERGMVAYKTMRSRRRGNRANTADLYYCRDLLGRTICDRAFGTNGIPPSVGTIAIFHPFRYYDRYQPRSVSEDLAYYQAAFQPQGAYFKRITWEATNTPGTVVRVQVRIDGKPTWNSPTNQNIGGHTLYEFVDPKKGIINRQGDVIEYRVLISYKPGAFANNAWKETPRVRKIAVEYLKNTRVLKHEELAK